jgi:hypothetical protein
MPKLDQTIPAQRFTADEIVRAIEAVEQTGLTVRGVEITQSGSIKIETGPRQQQSSRAATGPPDANAQADTAKKKQA